MIFVEDGHLVEENLAEKHERQVAFEEAVYGCQSMHPHGQEIRALDQHRKQARPLILELWHGRGHVSTESAAAVVDLEDEMLRKAPVVALDTADLECPSVWFVSAK